jgi:hypothetical protein
LGNAKHHFALLGFTCVCGRGYFSVEALRVRFATKFDRWLVVLLVLAATMTCVMLPAMHFFVTGIPLGLVFLPAIIWAAALVGTLPQYYEVREDGLFLRQGWRKTLIAYAQLTELQPMSDSRSAGVFSTDRVLVITQNDKRFIIAPAEQQRFMDEVAKRTPQLERKSFGLALPFSMPTMI